MTPEEYCALLRSPAIQDRFWKYVDRRGPDECWPWTGDFYPVGYGRLSVTVARGEYKDEGAHRIAFATAGGVLVPGIFVCHRCDFRPCVNERHLFGAPHSENMIDCRRKGRLPAAKINDQIASRIRADTRPASIAAVAFGISKSTVLRVRRGEAWAPQGDING